MTVERQLVSEAVKQALSSEMAYKHGAVIWKNNTKEVVATGFNKIVTKERRYRNGLKSYSLHAEINAILKAVKRLRTTDLSNYNIVVVRKAKTKLSNSKPCKHCMALIRETKIKNVYYSTKEDKIKQLK